MNWPTAKSTFSLFCILFVQRSVYLYFFHVYALCFINSSFRFIICLCRDFCFVFVFISLAFVAWKQYEWDKQWHRWWKKIKINSQRLWLAMHSIELHRRPQATYNDQAKTGPHMLGILLWWIIMGIVDFTYTSRYSSDANICTYTMRQTKHRIQFCCWKRIFFGIQQKESE